MEAWRLTALHRWNGWNALFLLVSGVLLYSAPLRGVLGEGRVWLRDLHILSGLASLALLAAYLPLAGSHWRRLTDRIGQQLNVLLLAGLLLGWGLTGILLWAHRLVDPVVAEAALLWHDRLTWLALPWALAHSVTRYARYRLLPVTVDTEGRRLLLAAVASAAGLFAWSRLGGVLGLPGFRGGAASPARDSVGENRGDPPPAGVVPPALSNPPQGGGGRGRFRMYTVAPVPRADFGRWRLSVKGLVTKPLTLTWAQFTALPRTVQVSDFHCVTGWSVLNVTYEGVRLSELLAQAGVDSQARYVRFFSADGLYTDTLPLEVARQTDVMLAYIMDASPLPTPLGGPVRLVIPPMYAYKSVKWVVGLELLDHDVAGYWEERGYPTDAWVRGV